MRILQVEDDRATAQSVELMLKSEGFSVYTTDLGEEGADLANIYDYDLVLLDIGLPDISGLDVLRRLRAARVRTPVMMLTGHSDIVTKKAAFAAGADDYLTKPFHKDELVARAHAIIRRSKGHAQAIIQAGPIAVNLDAKQVTVNGATLHLTGKEYQIVELMALRLEQTVSKENLLNHLYGGMDEPEIKIIDVFVCKVRSKLRRAGAGGHIQTVWGRGYRMMPEAGEDREQKKGVMASNIGRILGLLAKTPSVPRGRLWMAGQLEIEPNNIWSTLTNLRDKRWIERQGSQNNVTWSITPAGIAENARRQAYATAA
jgi:two-component system cell cycle response regulator CtrA